MESFLVLSCLMVLRLLFVFRWGVNVVCGLFLCMVLV